MLRVFHREALLMGNRFGISLVHDDAAFAESCIDDAIHEISRIEALLSTFREDSETHRINLHAGGRPVPVSRETYELIERSIRISSITQGAFDITYGSIDRSLWNFDTTMTRLPDPRLAKSMTRLVNYRNIVLDQEACTVSLLQEGMRIGFGGIGKGYAAEMARKLLKDKGIQGGVVNASGDLTVWGRQHDGKAWSVGIAHPDQKDRPFAMMDLHDSAVATSGNYEKFVVINGKKYSHTIDPRTGMPVTGIKSVTVFSPNAELSDALATPVTIMGVEAGLHLVNQLPGVECVIIDDENKLYTSKHINLS